MKIRVLGCHRPWWLASYLLALALWAPSYGYAAPAGTVSALTGQVSLQRAGRPVAVINGTPVEVGDRITTGTGSQATISLTDGTQFELAEASTMVLAEDQVGANGQRLKTQINLFSGLLHSLVHFAPGNAPNYEVHTPNAVAAARGTNYDTDYVNGQPRKEHQGCLEFTDVTVYEGVVSVTNPKNPTAGSTTVTAGHKTTVPCGLLLGPTATAEVSTGIIAGGAALGAGAIGSGVVIGVGVGGGFGGGSTGGRPTVRPTPPVTGVR